MPWPPAPFFEVIMWKKISVILLVSICLLSLAFYGGWRVGSGGTKTEVIETASVTQKSGADIRLTRTEYKSGKITGDIEADGKGEAILTIPTDRIPEVQKWKIRTHEIQGTMTCLYYDRAFLPVWGLSYWRRWSVFSAGVGLNFGKNSDNKKYCAGLTAGASIMF